MTVGQRFSLSLRGLTEKPLPWVHLSPSVGREWTRRARTWVDFVFLGWTWGPKDPGYGWNPATSVQWSRAGSARATFREAGRGETGREMWPTAEFFLAGLIAGAVLDWAIWVARMQP